MLAKFRHFYTLLFVLLLVACEQQAVQPTPTAISAPAGPPRRIALLAPFEGRYRDIGYDSLYAARLALQDSGVGNIELLPTDDGGTPLSAVDRALALAGDPQVYAVLAIGYAAVDGNTQIALGDIPVLIVGDWGAQPLGQNVLVLGLGNVGLPDDSFFFSSVRETRDDRGEGDFSSSAVMPDETFAQRYAESDPFAPPPTPLATLTYDATRILIQAVATGTDRASTASSVSSIDYEGINGRIRFIAHNWINHSRRLYRVQNGTLALLDDAVG